MAFLGSVNQNLAVWATFPMPELGRTPQRVAARQLVVTPCCLQAQQVPYNASKLYVPVIPSLLRCMRNSSEEAPRLKIPYLCCCKALIPSTITSSPPPGPQSPATNIAGSSYWSFSFSSSWLLWLWLFNFPWLLTAWEGS